MMRKLFGGGAPAPAPAPAQVPVQDTNTEQQQTTTTDPSIDINSKPITKSNTPNNSSNNLSELGKEENNNTNDKKIDNEINKNTITSTPPKDDKTGTSYTSRMGRFFGMGKKDTTSSPDPKETKDVNQLTAGGGVGTPDKSTTDTTTDKGVDKSTTDKSTTDKSTTDKSTTDKSTTDKSTTDKSTTDKSTTDKSTTDNKSTTDKSTTDKSATDKSTTDKATTDKATTDKATTDKATTDKASTDKATTETANKKDITLTAGGGSSKDKIKSESKSTTPNTSTNNLQELEKTSAAPDKTSTDDDTNTNTPKDKLNSKSSTPNTNSSNGSRNSTDKKKTLTPIKENIKKYDKDDKDDKDDNTVTSDAGSVSSSKPIAEDKSKATDVQKKSKVDNKKAANLTPESESNVDNVSSESSGIDQSKVSTTTTTTITTEKDKASITKDLSKELNDVAKEKDQPQKPVKPSKNEVTVVKGDVIDIQNVDKAMEVICNELLRFQGSINAVHDKAIPIFTSFDHQVNGTLTGKVSSSEFAQVILVLTDEKGQEKVFADSCVTVYNNFCDADNMLDYNAWLAAMGFERSDEELYSALASSLSGLIETDNRSQSKVEKYFSASIGQSSQPSESLNRFVDSVKILGLNFTLREITRLHSKLSVSSSGVPQSTVLKTISDSNNESSFDQQCLSILKRSGLSEIETATTATDKDKGKGKKDSRPLKYGLRSGSDIERALYKTIKSKFLNPVEIIQNLILSAYPDMNPNDQTLNTAITIPNKNIAVAIRDIGDNITDGEMQRLLLYLNKGKAMSTDEMKASLDLNSVATLFRVPAAENIIIKKLVISLKNEQSTTSTDPSVPNTTSNTKRKVTCELAATTSANTLAWSSALSSQESSTDSWTWELDQIEPVPCTIKGSNIIFKVTEEDQVDSSNDSIKANTDTNTNTNTDTTTQSNDDKIQDNISKKVKKLLTGKVSIPLDALKDFSLIPSSSSSSSSSNENIKFVKVPVIDSDNNQIGDIKFTFSIQRDSTLDDMSRAHKKEIEKAEAEKTIKNDPLVLLSDYIADIITALLTNESKPEPEVVDVRPRLRRNRRMLAQKEGNLGGLKVLSDIQAVTKLQALWRGKRIRKRRRRQYIAIREIQRFIRGKLQRMRFKRQVQRYKRLESSEAERLERLRRIRAQERELVLLQGISGSDYIGFERLRKTNSVKAIQRFWRKKQSKNPLSSSPHHPIGAESKVHSEELKLQREQARLLEIIQQVHGTHETPKRVLENREVDPLGLAQLQRRIRDKAQQNSKMREKVRFNPIATSTRLFDGKGGDRSDSKKGPRRKYQELAECQQRVSILLDDYLMKKPIHQHQSKDRLYSLSNCKNLSDDLQQLPTLEEAREMIKNKKQAAAKNSGQGATTDGKKPNLVVNTSHEETNNWFDELSRDDIGSSVLVHIKGINAMRSKNEWGIVTAPHDVTGPPINIKELSKVIDTQLQTDGTKLFPSPASAWINGKDSEESLMWIAYSAQRSKFGSKANEGDENVPPPSPSAEDEKSHKAARAILGDVNGEELLGRVAKELSTVQTRREFIRKKIDSERNREGQLAEIFENEALSLIRQNMAFNAHRNLSDLDKKRRDDATKKIQSLYRGQKDRKKVSVLKAEKRVVAALQVLLTELQKDGNSVIQMDAASLYKLSFGKHTTTNTTTNNSSSSSGVSKKLNPSTTTKIKSSSNYSSVASLESDKKIMSDKKNVKYDLKPSLSFVDHINDAEYSIASPKTPLSSRDTNTPRNHIPSGNQLKRSTDDISNGNLTPMSDRLNEVSIMSHSQYSPLRGDGYISSPSQSGTLESFSPYHNHNNVATSSSSGHSFPISPKPDISAKGITPSPRGRRDSK